MTLTARPVGLDRFSHRVALAEREATAAAAVVRALTALCCFERRKTGGRWRVRAVASINTVTCVGPVVRVRNRLTRVRRVRRAFLREDNQQSTLRFVPHRSVRIAFDGDES